jgi:Fe-coproporphyrin III synthase
MSTRHLLNLAFDHLRSLPILILYLTDGCNSRCVTCDIWQNPRLNMRRELVEQLAAEIKPLGIRWVVLSGGEAMQHPHWAVIAARFRAEGARVILLTNGLFLRKQAADVIANVDEVVVSLDGGTAATYEAIRGVDAFDLVLEGILAVRAGGTPVTTRTVVQRANYTELPQIVVAAKRAGVTSISFLTVDTSNPYAFGNREIPANEIVSIDSVRTRYSVSVEPQDDDVGTRHAASAEYDNGAEPISPSALTHDDITQFEVVLAALERDHADDFAAGLIAESPPKLRRMISYFRALLGDAPFPPVRCNAPHTSVVVQVDGTLRPCYFLPTMGKLEHGTPLRVGINGEMALALRQAYRMGERAECQSCVCPLYKGARALLSL